jgi:hypothetical protein
LKDVYEQLHFLAVSSLASGNYEVPSSGFGISLANLHSLEPDSKCEPYLRS